MAIPTLRQLQFLAALGDTGSFSRAAEACHVTQPTLSAGIKELEELLGVRLADREARGARLTHAGELAVSRASALLADAHALVQVVQFLFASSNQHPLAKKNGLSPEDLAGEDILLLEDGHCLRDHALSICRFNSGDHAGQVAATSLGTLVNMVAGGLGVSLLPRLAMDHGLAVSNDVAVRAFTTPVIGRQIGIAWKSGSPREADARKIGELVKAALN